MMKFRYLIGIAVISAPLPAFAAEPDAEITVVASGVEEPVDAIGQSISIVTTDEITSIQGPDLTRVLERLPGVTLTRNGGLGGFTAMRIRGADAEQTLVLVDGVRVADPSAPGGGFDFGNLLPGTIEKVELLRGSNGLIWGSQAIGGVLAVTSRQLEGVEASAEYGAYDTFYGSAAAGLTSGGFSGTLSGGYANSDGFSAAAGGTEPDGFRQWQVGGKAKMELGSGFAVTGDGRYADSRVDLDVFFGTPSDSPDVQFTRQASGRAGIEYSSDALQLAAVYSIADTQRRYDSPFGGYGYNGREQRAELRGRWNFIPKLAVIFGADNEWTRFDSTYDARESTEQVSGHALVDFRDHGVNLSGGVRLDHHDQFGDHWTFGANGSVEIAHGWRARASYGEGFKAPTLYQLLSDYGNSALRPETSKSYDVGIEKGDRNGTAHFALTAFRRDSQDLIDFVSCYQDSTGICANRPYGTYDNVHRARAQGFELEGDIRPTERLSLHAAYSYTEAVNRDTGNDLARRPRHALTVAGDWTTPLHDLTVGADVRVVGDSFDNAANTVPLDGYAVLTLRASLPVTEHFELFGRIENVGDAHYEEAAGFNTPGRSAYIGARARF
jgi:vitamin B12 transporter